MEGKRKHPKQFDSVYHDFDLPVDNHDKAAAEQQGAYWIRPRVGQMPTTFHHPVLRSASDSYLVTERNYNQGTRVLTLPPPLAAPETRPGNGEDPASLELTRPEVANDSDDTDVRDPPKNYPPFQRMEYQVISASRQMTTLTDSPPPSSATKAASVRQPGAGRTAQAERRDTF